MTQELHSYICEMTKEQFVAWLRAMANALELETPDERAYELSEWFLVIQDTPTMTPTPCSTPENHE